jgi:hypothetical protein
MNGKIASLPQNLRDQLNRRLDNGEPPHLLARWLNSLPEVQSLLASDFDSQPVSRQNMHQWSRHGFRAWKMRQQALEFAANYTPTPDQPAATSLSLTDPLIQWLHLNLAAAAQNLVATDSTDPDADLRRLRLFAADIVALRRGDLYARRIALEEKRYADLLAAQEDARQEERDELDRRSARTKRFRKMLLSSLPEAAHWLGDEDPDEHPVDTDADTDSLQDADPAALI